ncbi:MAG TPA: hypothetical protein VIH35_04290 [Kiritimatiellia bacterium]
MSMKVAIAVGLVLVVACGRVQAQGGEAAGNILENPGFEEEVVGQSGLPSAWSAYTATDGLIFSTNEPVRTGSRCVVIRANGESKSNRGLVQEQPVSAGSKLTFSAHVLNSRAEPLQAGTTGLINIEWLDAEGKELARSQSTPWNQSLSPVKWEKIEVSGKAPGGAATARFVIALVEGKQPGMGAFLVDDVAVTPK